VRESCRERESVEGGRELHAYLFHEIQFEGRERMIWLNKSIFFSNNNNK